MFLRTTLATSLLFLSHTALAQTAMLTVSPGGLQGARSISNACPTFSWGLATDANRYEVAVFNTSGNDSDDYQTHADAGEPVIKTNISAPALSWTPATNQCLDDGGSYLWFVRATTAEGESDWSEGRRFEVDVSEGVLAETVRQEVTSQLRQPATWRRMIQDALKDEQQVAWRFSSKRTMVSAADDQRVTTEGPPASGRSWVTEAQAATFVNPSAFRVSSPNGVVFDDPTFDMQAGGSGGIPAEGEGARFMWYPAKAALRAGIVSSTDWDDANIGFGSMALGRNTLASRDFSIALGRDTTASGQYSTAMGDRTIASGNNSTAMGSGATASGISSIAMGASTTASGHFSTAMGNTSTAGGINSKAMGTVAKASGNYSTAIGHRIFAIGDYSTAMGDGTIASSGYETAVGRYNTSYIPQDVAGWNAADRLFVIGNGSHTARSDALVVLKNGNTKISRELDVGGSLAVDGYLVANNYLIAGRLDTSGSTDVCRNGLNFLSTCSSSARYKDDIAPLSLGLDIVEQLEPVTFTWKDHEGQDLGFVAEEVAEIDPLLATYNEEGQIEGVKYKQLTAVLVNAIKTQQRQIDALHTELRQLRQQVSLSLPVVSQE